MIRPATAADLGTVEEIVQAAYEPWVELIGVRPLPLEADYMSLIAAGRVSLFPGGEGLIVLVPEPGVLLVENVAVRPALHGRGLGRLLMAFAESQARSLGLAALRLYTNERMTRNIALYESLGYHETARETIGGGRHVVHLRKLLD
jgi:ribosomal protein S18 acetylase RimI-like enzyme